MTGHSLGFVIVETASREGSPDDLSLCWVLPGGIPPLLPGEGEAGKMRDRLAAHAAIDADLAEGVTFGYTVAEVVSR